MLTLIRGWVILSALLCGGGWLLSSAHQLNRLGYFALFAVAAAAAVRHFQQHPLNPEAARRAWRKWRRRYSRPAPLIFLACFAVTILGAILYPPGNGDTNAYRVPRVYHWLAAEAWHWIPTLDARMNMAGCGFEWLAAPVVLFTKSARLFFLPNLISYFFLPGLLFSVYFRLGLRRRVAWWWTWLTATGWCYLLQSGETINDSYAVIFALASVHFALRARRGGQIGELWLAILSAALLTGTKQTAIPLTLICFVAVLPGLPRLLDRPITSACVLAWSLTVSAVPTFFFNYKFTGNWTGLPPNIGPDSALWGNAQLPSAFWGIIGNSFCLPLQNLLPPIFPFATKWLHLMQRFLQTSFGSHFRSFESFGLLSASATEASAGIGLGICVLLVVSLVAARRVQPAIPAKSARPRDRFLLALRIAPWVSLLYFMAKIGTYQNARQLGPYYALLFPLLLTAPGLAVLTRRRWWRRLALAVMLFAGVVLATERGRPMFPALTMLNLLQRHYPHSAALARIEESFSIRLSLKAAFDHLFEDKIPPTENVIGYATVTCGCEPHLWKPFSRRVERVLPGDTPEDLKLRGMRYVAVDFTILELKHQTIEAWAARHHGTVIATTTWELHAGTPPGTIHLVRLD